MSNTKPTNGKSKLIRHWKLGFVFNSFVIVLNLYLFIDNTLNAHGAVYLNIVGVACGAVCVRMSLVNLKKLRRNPRNG